MISTEKPQKYQHFHLVKFDKYDYLTGEKILSFGCSQIIQQAKFTYYPLEKTFGNQKEKKGHPLKS